MNLCLCAYLYISLCIEGILSLFTSLCFSCILSWIICIEFVMTLNIHQVFGVCVLLCFIKPILGNRYVRSRGFIVSEPRETVAGRIINLCYFILFYFLFCIYLFIY